MANKNNLWGSLVGSGSGFGNASSTAIGTVTSNGTANTANLQPSVMAPGPGWYWDTSRLLWVDPMGQLHHLPPPGWAPSSGPLSTVPPPKPTVDKDYFRKISEDLAKSLREMSDKNHQLKKTVDQLSRLGERNTQIVMWMFINHPDLMEEFSVWAKTMRRLEIGDT